MTFSIYNPLTGKSPQVYPPVAPVLAPDHLGQTYVGSVEMQRRIRRAIVAFAIRTWGFWQATLFLFVLCGAVSILVLRSEWVYYPWAALFTVLMAGTAPLIQLREIRSLSATYATPDATYGASYDSAGIFWQTSFSAFRIEWSTIAKSFSKSGVTILSLLGTRAIVVLPDELLTQGARNELVKFRS